MFPIYGVSFPWWFTRTEANMWRCVRVHDWKLVRCQECGGLAVGSTVERALDVMDRGCLRRNCTRPFHALR